MTFTAGVPTVWLGILDALDKNPGAWDTSSLKAMVVGGAAAPQAMIEGFEKRHGLQVHPRLGHDRDHAARARSPG